MKPMDDFLKDFDGEFSDMSAGEELYAEALAHLLDMDTADYIEFLKEDDNESSNIAAESDDSYADK